MLSERGRAAIASLDQGHLISLFAVAVALERDDEEVFTCGMHIFDRPDAQMPIDGEVEEAARFVQSFSLYGLTEDPILAAGHTFAPDASTPRCWLERWPDSRNESRSPRHNPFGVWRLRATAPSRPPPSKLEITPVPTLVSLLVARERELGRPLRRDEVEAIRDSCAAIAMPRDVARTVERNRGYADIDAGLAWEQWRLVRRHHDL